ELVDEALEEEAILRAADRAPETHRQMRVLQNATDIMVRNLVALIGQAIMRLAFHSVLERPSSRHIDRAHGELRLKRVDRSIGCERCPETYRGLRTIAVGPQILRTVPGQLHRLADILRDKNRVAHLVIARPTS